MQVSSYGMDIKMKILVFGASLILSSISSATEIIENEADTFEYLLNNLKSTQEVVQQLLGRVEQLASENKGQQLMILNQQKRIEHLERRDYDQQQLNVNIHRQLAAQRQRISSLERSRVRVKTILTSNVKKEKTYKDNSSKVKQADSNKDRNKTVIEYRSEDQVISVGGIQDARARIRRLENEQNIAFFATLSSHLQHAGIGQTFIFDRVVTNLGNGYNNLNGNFIAPVSGTYVFSATLLSLYHKNAHSQFMKNGNLISSMYVSGGEAGYDTTSQTIVLELQKGDDIFIKNNDIDAGYHGAHYNSFSGFLLQQNFSDTVVVGRK